MSSLTAGRFRKISIIWNIFFLSASLPETDLETFYAIRAMLSASQVEFFAA